MSDDYSTFVFDKFIKRIRARLHYNNQNWLAIICGQTGSGKSYSALSIAGYIGGKCYVVFNPLEFMTLLNSGKLQKGDIIIFDEAGVGMSSRDWYSQQNKLLGSVLQTFRNMNVGVIFTTPDLSFIDLQARKLFHNYLETSHIDRDEGLASLKVYDIQPNSRLGKEYYKHPKFRLDSGRVLKMSHIEVEKPSEKLIDYYENKKSAYTKALNEKVLSDLMPKQKKKKYDVNEVVKKVLEDKTKYQKEYNRRKFIDAELIRKDFSLTISKAKLVKSQIEDSLINSHT